MNKKDKKQLNELHYCASYNCTFTELCKRLKVTPSGAGKKIYRLMKADYEQRRKQDY